jgi:hypothetical protein
MCPPRRDNKLVTSIRIAKHYYMPKPEPPAFVKMPRRPKTQRRREVGEEPKGTKLSRVGIKMRCRLCGKYDHNARRCPKNPEAGNKQNAHIKR